MLESDTDDAVPVAVPVVFRAVKDPLRLLPSLESAFALAFSALASAFAFAFSAFSALALSALDIFDSTGAGAGLRKLDGVKPCLLDPGFLHNHHPSSSYSTSSTMSPTTSSNSSVSSGASAGGGDVMDGGCGHVSTPTQGRCHSPHSVHACGTS